MKQLQPRISGELKAPGDKSITHRALVFAALTSGRSTISGLSPAQDCRSTIACLQALGLTVEPDKGLPGVAKGEPGKIAVASPGLAGLRQSSRPLYAGNSGTTIRLLSGLAAGLPFVTSFDGDESLRGRPMSRVLDPLCRMGACVQYQSREGYAPYAVSGGKLAGIDYTAPVASAQVQTALLIAGLQAQGRTTVTVPGTPRDHTERMFRHIGVPFQANGAGSITVQQLTAPIAPFHIDVPADISSAAFFMVAAALLPGSGIVLPAVGVNPGRRLIVDVLRAMGASVTLEHERTVSGEPVADIAVTFAGRLKGTTVGGDIISAGIDELPILSLAGALCDGLFSVRGAAELRVKESDRLKAIVLNLRAAGAGVTEYEDGFDIQGQAHLPGGSAWTTFGDHRLAMTAIIAGLVCDTPLSIDDTACVAISYPSFESDLKSLLK